MMKKAINNFFNPYQKNFPRKNVASKFSRETGTLCKIDDEADTDASAFANVSKGKYRSVLSGIRVAADSAYEIKHCGFVQRLKRFFSIQGLFYFIVYLYTYLSEGLGTAYEVASRCRDAN